MARTKTDMAEESRLSKLEENSGKLAFITSTFAIAAALKHRGFTWALRFYPSGGGGFNVYKHSSQHSKPLRRFALAYHPIWNEESKQKEFRLHYHRGEKFKDIKKHRPYQGGW